MIALCFLHQMIIYQNAKNCGSNHFVLIFLNQNSNILAGIQKIYKMIEKAEKDSQVFIEEVEKENHYPGISKALLTNSSTSQKNFPDFKFKNEEPASGHPLQTFQQPEETRKPTDPIVSHSTLKEGSKEERKGSLSEGDRPVQMQQEKETTITKNQDQSSEAQSRQLSVKIEAEIAPKLNSCQPAKIQYLQMIHQGQYSRNRFYLYGWVKRECEKFKLQQETFANAVALMDEFYKYQEFVKEQFVMTALCFIIISSKALEPKVLYTSAVANVNKYNYQQMLKIEADTLNFFEFQVTQYNFVRVGTEFMRRWDKIVRVLEPWRKNYLFFEPEPLSYIQYLEVLMLCENHMRHKGNLLQPTVKKIFQNVLIPRCEDIDAAAIIDRIFGEPCLEARHEYLFAYDIKEESEEELRGNLAEWRRQFSEKTRPEICKTFSRYEEQKSKYKCYGEFLCLLLP